MRILLIPGDGIGQEVVLAAARVLGRLGLDISFDEAPAGFDCFQACGEALPSRTLELARGASAVLFGACASPLGEVAGYASPILALRRELRLFANLRPIQSLPGPFSRPGIDLLIVRENSEGLYSGRERREGDTAVAERVITREASERIARVACEQALRRASQRASPATLTVVHKANVLRVSDGLFRQSVLAVARQYPELRLTELLIDTAAMRLVQSPESFDVMVTTNLFGDILSDEASALIGGLGVAPSANLGEGTPVFEPVHGAAPDIAGRGIANPVGAMLSGVMVLEHFGEGASASKLRWAIRATLESGISTPDLGGSAGTEEFTQAVCRSLAG
ncbi:MAG: isocitrate/isopropylmalate dehydrogenase family protein [Anaerolineales bacterium]